MAGRRAGEQGEGLEEQSEKIGFQKELGADRLVLPDLQLAGLQHFSRRMTLREPAALVRIKDPHQTVEIACFLRLTLLRVTDASPTLLDHRIAALWRGARERAEDARESRLQRFRELLGDLAGLAGNEALDAELQSRLQALIARFAPERDATQVAAIWQELGCKTPDLARLLKTVRAAALAVPADHRLTAAFATLDALAAASASTLPEGQAQPFGASWQGLIDQPDRAAALGCSRAATLMTLKRALRNRSVSVAHSLSHQAPEDRLIPLELWRRDRKRFTRDINLPAQAEANLQPLEAGLCWSVTCRPCTETPSSARRGPTVSAHAATAGEGQARRRRSDQPMVGLCPSAGRPNRPSVLSRRRHGSIRGGEPTRLEAMPTCSLVGILYDQPIVLNHRQAGAAIESALRQRQVGQLERVAVDTHGFTHFVMTLAKVPGFDLCLRLARPQKRLLYLPRGFEVPPILRPIVAETVSRRAISRGWDGLLRLGASAKQVWYPATEALDRFGSAATGDPVYEAGDALGKLLRTLDLCDDLSNLAFRTDMLDLLNQGEAVHSLQRAIHNGGITAKYGRTTEQLTAISGALALLANIIMAWNTHRLQAVIDLAPSAHADEVISHMAPIGHKHTNRRGILRFDFAQHKLGLLQHAPIASNDRVSERKANFCNSTSSS